MKYDISKPKIEYLTTEGGFIEAFIIVEWPKAICVCSCIHVEGHCWDCLLSDGNEIRQRLLDPKLSFDDIKRVIEDFVATHDIVY